MKAARMTLAAGLALAMLGASGPQAQDEKEHEALRAMKAVYEKAVNEGKLELLEPLLDADFTGVMLTGEEVAGFAGLKAYWEKLWKMIGQGGKYTTTLDPERSWIQGDVAVARGTAQEHVVAASGNEYRFTPHWTAVLVRREGKWKVLRVQGTMDPVGNPFVQAIVSGSARWTGIIVGILALGAGGTAGFFLGRRRARSASA